jgi:hypothetical protein
MYESVKLILQLCIAGVVTLIGCGLLIAGFCVPPLGIIDNSLLIAFGEACSFVGALLGIDYTYRYKIYTYNKEREKKD